MQWPTPSGAGASVTDEVTNLLAGEWRRVQPQESHVVTFPGEGWTRSWRCETGWCRCCRWPQRPSSEGEATGSERGSAGPASVFFGWQGHPGAGGPGAGETPGATSSQERRATETSAAHGPCRSVRDSGGAKNLERGRKQRSPLTVVLATMRSRPRNFPHIRKRP